MGQEDDGTSPRRRKPARVHQIVLGIRSLHRRSESQEFAERSFDFGFEFWVGHLARGEDLNLASLQSKVARTRVGVELIAGRNNAPVVIENEFLRIILRQGRSLAGAVAVTAGPVTR